MKSYIPYFPSQVLPVSFPTPGPVQAITIRGVHPEFFRPHWFSLPLISRGGGGGSRSRFSPAHQSVCPDSTLLGSGQVAKYGRMNEFLVPPRPSEGISVPRSGPAWDTLATRRSSPTASNEGVGGEGEARWPGAVGTTKRHQRFRSPAGGRG